MVKDRTTVKDFYGKIIGFIETIDNGDKRAKDFYGKILGTYVKRLDITRDFYGRIVGKGDLTYMLIGTNVNKK